MSYPTKYTRQYDYVGYQNGNPNRPLPAGQIHADLNGVAQSTKEIVDFLKTAIRSDGAVSNEAVGFDQLTTDVKASIGDTTSVAAILQAKTDAETAATASASSAGAAATSATSAAANATAAGTSATNAATSATAASTSAGNAATTLASAVVGAAASSDGEVMLFSGTTGKAAKRSNSLSGLLKVTSGVASAAAAGTDYQAADAQLFSNVPINSQSAAYALVLTDGQKCILHPGTDNNARTFTIPANASVAYPLGTVITFVNFVNTLTIAITSDTLTLAGSGATGSRTLAANGIATAIKVGSNLWLISGTGLS